MLNKPRMFINADDPLSLVFGGLPTFQGLPVLPLPDNDEVKIVKIDEGCIGRVTLQAEPCQACLDEGALCSSCEDDTDRCPDCGVGPVSFSYGEFICYNCMIDSNNRARARAIEFLSRSDPNADRCPDCGGGAVCFCSDRYPAEEN